MYRKIFLFLPIFLLFFLFLREKVYAAPSLSLSPTTKSVAVGETFDVAIILDTGGNNSNGCDVVLTFTPSIIKIKNVSFGSSPLFTSSNVSSPDNTNGKLILNSSVISSAFAYSGKGTLATVTFEALSTGSTAVSFICNPGQTNGDSNIWNTQAEDIINCSANINGNYSITSSSSTSTSTTTTTNTTAENSGETESITPTTPEAGNTSLTTLIAGIGTFLLIFGVLAKIAPLFF